MIVHRPLVVAQLHGRMEIFYRTHAFDLDIFTIAKASSTKRKCQTQHRSGTPKPDRTNDGGTGKGVVSTQSVAEAKSRNTRR
jgi:hypothetical protein